VYEATCHGKHYYVTKDGTAALSEFTLAVQEIARVQYQALYYPRPVARTVKIIRESSPDGLDINSITITVDRHGWVTQGVGSYSNLDPNQPRPRLDNVVTDANLRSAISNTKSQ
jgi:hypothetical protein